MKWIPAGRQLYRVKGNKIELVVEDTIDCGDVNPYEFLDMERPPPPSSETKFWPRAAYSMCKGIPDRKYLPCKYKQPKRSLEATMRTWNYWRSLGSKEEFRSELRREISIRVNEFCQSCNYFSSTDVCEFCQAEIEIWIKLTEENLEKWLKSLWQECIATYIFLMFRPKMRRWSQLSQDEQRAFLLAYNLDPSSTFQSWRHRLDSGECTPQEFHCFVSLLSVCGCYEHPLKYFWNDFHLQRRQKLVRQMLALAEQGARQVGKLYMAGTQTALAMRERKMLCTSRGGLANEQHFFSIRIAHLSTISPHLARMKALFEDITDNRGDRQYATIPST